MTQCYAITGRNIDFEPYIHSVFHHFDDAKRELVRLYILNLNYDRKSQKEDTYYEPFFGNVFDDDIAECDKCDRQFSIWNMYYSINNNILYCEDCNYHEYDLIDINDIYEHYNKIISNKFELEYVHYSLEETVIN